MDGRSPPRDLGSGPCPERQGVCYGLFLLFLGYSWAVCSICGLFMGFRLTQWLGRPPTWSGLVVVGLVWLGLDADDAAERAKQTSGYGR